MCFILLVSLEGLKANVNNTSVSPMTLSAKVTEENNSISSLSKAPTQTSTSFVPTTTSTTLSTTKEKQRPTKVTQKEDCLIDLGNKKEMTLWMMIALLGLISFLLLVIILCMACKCSQGTRKGELVLMKSSTRTKKNSVNGGPSENEVMLKECSSVKVEVETTPDENQEPEEEGGAAANMENQDSGEENKNSDNDISKATLTQEAEQSDKTDHVIEDLENAG
ncbi:hypothetical protein C0J50_16013 [Silurus asotus]|uniref:Uncharacterized protein n=1 Tax=Silurus asotus TaxID=30991 RepID=A0AAD5FQ26_SILAS|nr:hypothetical protein C0J50_16013 [Silurus asotus]